MGIAVGQVWEEGSGRRVRVVEVLADYAVVEVAADPLHPEFVGARMSYGFEQLSELALVDGD